MLGAVHRASAGIAVAYRIWVVRPGPRDRAGRSASPALHRLFVNKWYFDELIDLVIVRPVAWFGRWARDSFERIVINGALVGGTTGIVRAGSAAVRALQTGLLRSYAGARRRRPRRRPALLPDLRAA